ncbi:hypothetical protein F0562_022530 [Nyssa sinensis]|uniref:Uncharacterized protein n=1 Tax=Nyssa sinensis TaxID=561372 RepID=A0A5J5BNZ9_9ASTE|nr:hypothetical protein F0562_022530 [Nyssa sinensis]
MPKPPRKKTEDKHVEVVLPKLDVLEVEGAQEIRVVPSGLAVQEAAPSEPYDRVSSNAKVLAQDTRKDGMCPSPIANSSDAPVRESQSSQIIVEDDNAMHNLILDVLRTLGLSNDILEPSVTTDMNFVEELNDTLEDAQNRGEHVDVQDRLIQERGWEPITFGVETSPS